MQLAFAIALKWVENSLYRKRATILIEKFLILKESFSRLSAQ
jgi:hypothetical protein